MSRPEGARFVRGPLLLAGAMLAATVAHAEPAPYRYQAPIAIDAPAPFVQMALPVAAYGHVEQDDLRDLRIVDAKGERVPFAVLPPLATVQLSEQVREASLYPLPARPTAAGVWPSPVDVVVEGDRISVRRRGGPADTVAAAPRESGGWLIDSGETRRGDPPPKQPDPALVGAGRVLGRLPDRDQRRPAPMAVRRQRPGDGVAIGGRRRWRSRSSACPSRPAASFACVWAEPGARRR